MIELRSIHPHNCWHIIQDNSTLCQIKPVQHAAQSQHIHTCTTEQYENYARDNKLPTKYYTRPGTLCQRCLKIYRPDLFQPRNTKEDPTNHNTKRDSILLNLHILPDDYELIKNFGYDTTRFDTLSQLTPTVQQLTLIPRSKHHRTLNIKIPTPLDAAIRQQIANTGHSYTTILATAIRLYQSKHKPQ